MKLHTDLYQEAAQLLSGDFFVSFKISLPDDFKRVFQLDLANVL